MFASETFRFWHIYKNYLNILIETLHFQKIFPKIGRYKYLSRGGFKIPFTKVFFSFSKHIEYQLGQFEQHYHQLLIQKCPSDKTKRKKLREIKKKFDLIFFFVTENANITRTREIQKGIQAGKAEKHSNEVKGLVSCDSYSKFCHLKRWKCKWSLSFTI